MSRIAIGLLVALASAGCLRSTTVIDLRPDGTGTILQETGLTSQALAMMKSFTAANQAGDAPPGVFGEEQARKAAETMGVKFVSGEPFKTGDLEGYRARFAFDDISKVMVNMEQGAGVAGGDRKQPPFRFNFDRRGASSVLTIQMPDQKAGMGGALPKLPGAGGSDAEKAQAAQAMAMMKAMMKGLFVDVSMNVDGRILKTNAPFVQGSHVTLMQIDFDQLLADDAGLQKLQSASDLKSLAAVPGFKMVSDPKVTIEFAR
jgi:hypothetical protein